MTIRWHILHQLLIIIYITAIGTFFRFGVFITDQILGDGLGSFDIRPNWIQLSPLFAYIDPFTVLIILMGIIYYIYFNIRLIYDRISFRRLRAGKETMKEKFERILIKLFGPLPWDDSERIIRRINRKNKK